MLQTVKTSSDFGATEARSGNLLEGTDLQYVNGPALLSIWATTETPVSVLLTARVGSDTIVDEAQCNPQAAVGDVDRETDLIVDRVLVPSGVRRLLNVFFSNSTGGDLNGNVLVQVDQP